MRKSIPFALVLILALALPALAQKPCTAVYGDGPATFRLATGSPGELGLLEQLASAFNPDHGTSLCWVKAGSGESLQMLKSGEVDMIMVHAPAAEKQAVEQGWARKRTLIGSNEFYLTGPSADPAGVRGASGAADAFSRIAGAKALFFSRGDNSGTHKKELAAWKLAGIEPSGAWYVVTGQFMMATLKRADAEQGYFMTDSSTYVAARRELHNLEILFRGDPFLVNTYHALASVDGATPASAQAAAFIDFVASGKGQQVIRDYGAAAYGDSLYNDAAYAAQYDH